MIVKYYDGDWHFIDGIQETEKRSLSSSDLIKDYDEREKNNLVTEHYPEENGFENNARLKVAYVGKSDLLFEVNGNYDYRAILDGVYLISERPLCRLILKLGEQKNIQYIVLLINQPCFLLNNEGKTIERLV